MRFATALLRHEPLLIEPRLLTSFVERCGWYQEAMAEIYGEPPKPRVEDGIGIVPICGPIGQGLMPIEKMWGACDVLDAAAAVEDFAQDNKVKALLLEIDSPGGTLSGVPELGELVAEFPKPTFAYTQGMACSAAYWIGSRADSIFCTPSADVGSIGVFTAWLNVTKWMELNGLFTEMVKAGTYKAMGYPGTDLTDEQRALIQARVDQVHVMFKDAVTRKRRFVDPGSMEGQSFYGGEAAQRGLVTATVPNRAAMLARIAQAAAG
ncbi:MAG: S49 family peptidase [Verrucomicrobiota bacterium JB022]|nr:S49 family peptidase [Verrucomicrobiota bacterium JB022]